MARRGGRTAALSAGGRAGRGQGTDANSGTARPGGRAGKGRGPARTRTAARHARGAGQVRAGGPHRPAQIRTAARPTGGQVRARGPHGGGQRHGPSGGRAGRGRGFARTRAAARSAGAHRGRGATPRSAPEGKHRPGPRGRRTAPGPARSAGQQCDLPGGQEEAGGHPEGPTRRAPTGERTAAGADRLCPTPAGLGGCAVGERPGTGARFRPRPSCGRTPGPRGHGRRSGWSTTGDGRDGAGSGCRAGSRRP